MAAQTFRTLIEQGTKVTAYCHNPKCNHRATLPLQLLADHFGLDAPATHDDLLQKLTCTKCGGKACGLRFETDPGTQHGKVGPNEYARMKRGR